MALGACGWHGAAGPRLSCGLSLAVAVADGRPGLARRGAGGAVRAVVSNCTVVDDPGRARVRTLARRTGWHVSEEAGSHAPENRQRSTHGKGLHHGTRSTTYDPDEPRTHIRREPEGWSVKLRRGGHDFMDYLLVSREVVEKGVRAKG